MGVLQEYGLIDIAATLRPLITFKGKEGVYESTD